MDSVFVAFRPVVFSRTLTPGIFTKKEGQERYLLGVLNSAPADGLLRTLISFGSGEVGAVKKVPTPEATAAERKHVGTMAETLPDLKSAWDSGNEIGTRFDRCWVIQPATTHEARALSTALERPGFARLPAHGALMRPAPSPPPQRRA